MLWLSVAAFALAWWLGWYLLARDPAKPVLRRSGGGLLAFAAALVIVELDWPPGTELALLCVPAVAWSGVFAALSGVEVADRAWRWGVVPLFGVLAVVSVAWGLALPAVLVAVAALAAGLAVLLANAPRLRTEVRGLLLVATPLLGLGTVLPLLGTDVLPVGLVVGAMAVDVVVLGVAIAVLDAFDEGQALAADMARSLLVAAAVAVVFGGQVGIAVAVVGERTPLILLLYGTVATAIGVQVLMSPIQTVADRVVLRPARLRAERAELREVSDALPRKAEQPQSALAECSEEEFARLTRRVISNYGDLGKLVASPLIDLPVIDDRLAARGVPDAPLARAAELKAVLLESIERLKPAGHDEFGTSEEWRHYNALFFYYVKGIRPYSVRTKRTGLDPASRQALRWFVEQVPERTLHNWQNAAARVIAADLRAEARTGA